MKHILAGLAAIILLVEYSCSNPGNKGERAEDAQEIVVDQEAILRDYQTWYNYTYFNIRLAKDFIGVDTNSVVISKGSFLSMLETGNFIPFKIKIRDNIPVYKLTRLLQEQKNIQSTIQSLAQIEKKNFEMEGKELPDYHFTDLNGKNYSKGTMQGKAILLKCWFIACTACVKEFPELNKMVDKYQGKSDIFFISLAIDKKPDLISFLTKKPFKYVVIPDEEEYMSEQLDIHMYPTHILVNKQGKIVKVTNSIDDMIPFLERQAG